LSAALLKAVGKLEDVGEEGLICTDLKQNLVAVYLL
jgi:hypothetical protein